MNKQSYDYLTDPILQDLISEAAADPDVIGLVLTGSRAVAGAVAPESDYDVIFLVTEEAFARYERTQAMPVRGANVRPFLHDADIWNEFPGNLTLDQVVAWELPAFAESIVLYDRTGETERVLDALRRMPPEQAKAAVESGYDAYLNGLYRSLKSWRRGNGLGARMEAAQSASDLLQTLFALEQRWRPYSSRLIFHLDELESQGWQANELREILLDLITTGDPRRQQVLARRIAALLRQRGFGQIYDSWEGKIDQALAWDFSG